jgi:putative transcriptional regulator
VYQGAAGAPPDIKQDVDSQAELAAALGVSRQTVISIESGRYLPSLPLAFTIARFFGLTVDKMFDPEDEEAGA